MKLYQEIEWFDINSKQKLIQVLYAQIERHGKNSKELYCPINKISEIFQENECFDFISKQN